MNFIKTIIDGRVTELDEELTEQEQYRQLESAFMTMFPKPGADKFFDTYCAVKRYLLIHFYEQGLRDGIALSRFVDEVNRE